MLYMSQIFVNLQGHLYLFTHSLFTFMEHLFMRQALSACCCWIAHSKSFDLRPSRPLQLLGAVSIAVKLVQKLVSKFEKKFSFQNWFLLCNIVLHPQICICNLFFIPQLSLSPWWMNQHENELRTSIDKHTISYLFIPL